MSEQLPLISIVLGTGRQGRKSEQVANYIYNYIKDQGKLRPHLIDVRDFVKSITIAPWENNSITAPWREIVKKSQAFFLVFPEYNRSYPGELKLLLDQEYEGYEGKPVGLATVSKGVFGGMAAMQSILPVLKKLRLKIMPYSLYFPQVNETFSKEKSEIDKQYKDELDRIIEDIIQGINK